MSIWARACLVKNAKNGNSSAISSFRIMLRLLLRPSAESTILMRRIRICAYRTCIPAFIPLYHQTYLVERKYDKKTQRYLPNHAYRICERHLNFLKEYLVQEFEKKEFISYAYTLHNLQE